MAVAVATITWHTMDRHFNFQLLTSSASYLGQVAVVAGQCKVHVIGLIVDKDPRVDGILVEVTVRATSDSVEIHQVVKVGDLTTLPSLHHV